MTSRSHDRQTEIRRFYDRWTPVMVEAAGPVLQGGLVKPSADSCIRPESSVRYLAELAGIGPGDRVLDAGCGVGGPAVAIARALPDVVIDGITVSEVQATMARRLVEQAGLADRVRVHVADFQSLPFRDGAFDVALYLEVTGYSPDRGALYRESARVLRPGGTVYVKDVFCREGPLTERQRRSMQDFDRLWACVRSPTLSETETAMRAAGFVDVRVREYPFVDMSHHYESMVSRDEGGMRLNAFGDAFLRFLPDLPIFFGEATAHTSGGSATGPDEA
ncbi:SAM-dependent methyltransferase [Geodermatophilus sp. SYSU D00698]